MSRVQIIGFWNLVHAVIISSDPEAPLSEEQRLHVSTPRGCGADPPQNGDERRSAYP